MTVVDHEHPIYTTHEVIHRHHYPRVDLAGPERHVDVYDDYGRGAPPRKVYDDDPTYGYRAVRGGRRTTPTWDYPPRHAGPAIGYAYGDMTDAFYLDKPRVRTLDGLRADHMPTYEHNPYSTSPHRRPTPPSYQSRAACRNRCGQANARYDDWAGTGFTSGVLPAYKTRYY